MTDIPRDIGTLIYMYKEIEIKYGDTYMVLMLQHICKNGIAMHGGERSINPELCKSESLGQYMSDIVVLHKNKYTNINYISPCSIGSSIFK